MTPESTLKLVALHLAHAVAVLGDAVADGPGFGALMLRLGWNVTSTTPPPAFAALAAHCDRLVTNVEALADDPTPEEVGAAVGALRDLVAALNALKLDQTPAGVDATTFLAEIRDRLVELLLVDHLSTWLPGFYRALRFAGLASSGRLCDSSEFRIC
jgi:hypothetical protein